MNFFASLGQDETFCKVFDTNYNVKFLECLYLCNVKTDKSSLQHI